MYLNLAQIKLLADRDERPASKVNPNGKSLYRYAKHESPGEIMSQYEMNGPQGLGEILNLRELKRKDEGC
jgi:hypothetical protein